MSMRSWGWEASLGVSFLRSWPQRPRPRPPPAPATALSDVRFYRETLGIKCRWTRTRDGRRRRHCRQGRERGRKLKELGTCSMFFVPLITASITRATAFELPNFDLWCVLHSPLTHSPTAVAAAMMMMMMMMIRSANAKIFASRSPTWSFEE